MRALRTTTDAPALNAPFVKFVFSVVFRVEGPAGRHELGAPLARLAVIEVCRAEEAGSAQSAPGLMIYGEGWRVWGCGVRVSKPAAAELEGVGLWGACLLVCRRRLGGSASAEADARLGAPSLRTHYMVEHHHAWALSGFRV